MNITYRPTALTQLTVKPTVKSKAGFDIVGDEIRVYDDDENLVHTEKFTGADVNLLMLVDIQELFQKFATKME